MGVEKVKLSIKAFYLCKHDQVGSSFCAIYSSAPGVKVDYLVKVVFKGKCNQIIQVFFVCIVISMFHTGIKVKISNDEAIRSD